MPTVSSWLIGALLVLGLFAAIGLAETLRPARPATRDSAQRWRSNILLCAAGLALGMLPALPLVAAAAAPAWLTADLLGRLGLPDASRLAAAILLQDLLAYGAHRLRHGLPSLWRFHAVHHSDPGLDVTTSLRRHPVDLLADGLLRSAAVLVLGLTPMEVGLFLLLGFAAQMLAHANLAAPTVPPRLGRVLGAVLVTPRFHMAHHARAQGQAAGNFGQIFSIWDRVLGTARRRPADLASVAFGHGEMRDFPAQEAHHLLLQPFRPRRIAMTGPEGGRSAPDRLSDAIASIPRRRRGPTPEPRSVPGIRRPARR